MHFLCAAPFSTASMLVDLPDKTQLGHVSTPVTEEAG